MLTKNDLQQIRNVINDAVITAIDVQVRPVIREETQTIIRDEVRPIIREETRIIIREEARTIIRDEVRPIIREEATTIVKNELKPIKSKLSRLQKDVSYIVKSFDERITSNERDIKAIKQHMGSIL